MSPHSTSQIRVPSFYRIFFLYIDPLICLSGIYLSFFDQATFLTNGVPSSLKHGTTPNDLPAHFIRSIGAYSVAIFTLQILLIWGFRDEKDGLNLRIWRILQYSILLIDVLLLFSNYQASPAQFLSLRSWDSGDWTNNGILFLVAVIRSAFLLGFGM